MAISNGWLLDLRGSVVDVVNARGVVSEHRRFDSYGNMLLLPAELTPTTRYGFQGRDHVFEFGVIHYRSRYYDPSLGRFISEDPLEFAVLLPDGPNVFAAFANSPILNLDPFGTEITNNTGHEILVLDEDTFILIPLADGHSSGDDRHEGYWDPSRPNEVYKTGAGLDTLAMPNGVAKPDYYEKIVMDFFAERLGKEKSGWKDVNFLDDHPKWKEAVDDAKNCNRH